jgi:hypothetical protein
MEIVVADSRGPRGFLSGRRACLTIATIAVVAFGLTVFVAWFLRDSIVWRSEVSVVKAELRSPDRLDLIVDSSNGDPEVTQLRESDREVQVEVVASSTPFQGGQDCLDVVQAQLQEPLGDRVVVDMHSQQSVSVTRVNSS